MKEIKCQFCGKKIEGYTQKQVEYMLKQHILSKHNSEFTISQAEPIK